MCFRPNNTNFNQKMSAVWSGVCKGSGYKLATKILKTQRKSILSENMMTENPENTPFAIQGFPSLIREGGRTVGSGRVAAIID